MKNQKAFTLIELLVVIAIIGVLASIVLVNLKGSKDKAKLARALSFSQSVRNALGAYTVGDWRFESINSGEVADTSGYGNNGTVNGASIVSGIRGNALIFDGNSDYIEVPNNGSLNFGIGDFTISAWIKTDTNTNSIIIEKVNLLSGTGFSLYVWPGDGSAVFYLEGNSGWVLVFTAILVNNNKWHYITAVREGDFLRIYRDGALSQTNEYDVGNIDNTDNLLMGKNVDNDYYFNGLIDEVRIYNYALTAAEIEKHYAEGVAKKGLVAK